MASTVLKAPGGKAAEEFLKERFGITWGPDVFGITEDGFTAEQSGTEGAGTFRLTLVGQCTREDVEKFVRLLWTKA